MTYANYINTRGSNTYTNYANGYTNTGAIPSNYVNVGIGGPYGYIFTAASTYTNYNNVYATSPPAYTMTAPGANFATPGLMRGADVRALREDVTSIAGNRVNADGKTPTTTPAFPNNTDINLAPGAPAAPGIFAGLFNEMRNNINTIWAAIKGGNDLKWNATAVPALPAAKVAGDPISGADYKALFDRTSNLASDQTRAEGYLNCANWTNTAGTAYAIGNGPYATTNPPVTGTYRYLTANDDDANKN